MIDVKNVYKTFFVPHEVQALHDVTYHIDPELCSGCTRCKLECPVDAIVGDPREVHVVVQETCIACGNCVQVCRQNAVMVS